MEKSNDSHRRPLIYNLPQLLFAKSRHKLTSLEWGRGTGKSTVLATRIKDYAIQLPRAKIAVPGETYKQLLTRTLPSTIEGLELIGYKKDLHYVVGGRPPKQWRWKEAYQPPLDYHDCIIFPNGTTFQMVSLDTDSGGRGNNFDGVIGDEAASMNVVRLSNNVLAANRGNIDRFRNHWLHHAILFAGSTALTQSGRWFSELADAAKLDPDKCLHIIATSFLNQHNLGEEFFKTCMRLMTTMQYNAEILCLRPGHVENGFYPNFSEAKHCYDATNTNYLFGLNYDVKELRRETCKSDSDHRDDLAIDFACDWGARINTMVCGQPAPIGDEYRFISAFHVLSPMTLHDLATKFCDYYETKSRKYANFHYDHTAVYKDAARTTSFADEMTKALQARGWTVNRIYHGQAPSHKTKFLFWSIAHREDGSSRLPVFRYNKNNCSFLIVSIQQAGALEGKDGIEKDKRPERREGQKQEEATHYSDAMDTLGFFKFKSRLGSAGYVF